ncbi:MAG: DoxX family protein [Bryobacteraceae bacterium]
MRPLDPAGWKTAFAWIAAIALSVLFLASGLWKITDPQSAAMRMSQALVPESWSLFAAVAFGTVETVSGVLVLVPRFRRWGAMLTGLLLLAFLGWFAIHYAALRGADCSCFPWVKRVVGPGFFIGDGLMLLLAAAAGLWSKPPAGPRTAALIFAAVAVFAGASYGVDMVHHIGARAPAAITVDGRPYSLQHGRIFLFFFNPECRHCMDAAKSMSQLDWGDTRVVAIPVEEPQYSAQFLQMTGLKAGVSTNFAELKQVFGFSGYPSGVALLNGRQKALLTQYEGPEPAATLKQLGFIY